MDAIDLVVDDVVVAVSTGMEHSINPLFSTSVPHPRHGCTPEEKLLYDIGIGFTPDDCCRILTTSNGVTASAVMIHPTEPDRILGMRCDDVEISSACLSEPTSSSVALLLLLIVMSALDVMTAALWLNGR